MQTAFENGALTLRPAGRVDSVNAPEFEKEIRELMAHCRPASVTVDCGQLDYMSSAGLRVLLRLKKKIPETSLINVRPDFFEILDTTGFTEIMEIKKAYRMVSLEHCELIAQGGRGKVYRLDRENILKVYENTDALPTIQHERELARAAFVLGVPTAIPYGVVQIAEGGYGAIYELLNARTYVQLYHDGEKSLDELAAMCIPLLKFMHTRIVRQSFVPSIRDSALGWAAYLKDYLEKPLFEKLYALIEAVPDDRHMVHGDFHVRNIMYQDGESLLIDMDKFSHGHPVFELSAMYNAYVGFGAADPFVSERFIGLRYEETTALWRRLLKGYLETENADTLTEVENKVKIISSARLMRHTIHYGAQNAEMGSRQLDWCRAVLEQLLPETDTLVF